jgi:hypothetical protein
MRRSRSFSPAFPVRDRFSEAAFRPQEELKPGRIWRVTPDEPIARRSRVPRVADSAFAGNEGARGREKVCESLAVAELARAHCEVCAPGTPPLAEEAAAAMSSEVPDWTRDGNRSLRREFSFPATRSALSRRQRSLPRRRATTRHRARLGPCVISAHDPRRLRLDAKRLRTRGEAR